MIWHIYLKPFLLAALQKTQESAIRLHEGAYKLLESQHFDAERIQGIAANVELRWQQLVMQSEDRRKLFHYSASFYKTSEQVWKSIIYCQKMCITVVMAKGCNCR